MQTTAGEGSINALRGTLIFCRDDPFLTDPGTAFVCEPDGLVICRDGVIEAVGPYAAMKAALPSNAVLADHSGCQDGVRRQRGRRTPSLPTIRAA